MADQSHFQEQGARQTTPQASRALERPPDAVTQHAPDAAEAPGTGQQVQAGQSPGIHVGELKATAGHGGARNLTVEWIDVWVGNNPPCRFNVRTLSGNGLEVSLEQLVYKRTFTGSGAVSTPVIPVVPIGTKGRLTARDTTTDETLEQPWTWVRLGGLGLLSRLWNAVKRSIWRSAGAS